MLSAGLCLVSLVSQLVPAAHAADASGTLTGSVSNNATRNQLEGAVVAVPALNLTTLTDNSGRFTLSNLPVGTHEIVVTYIGLDAVRERVSVGAGQRERGTGEMRDMTGPIISGGLGLELHGGQWGGADESGGP